jgi:hypothetical protein
MNMEKEPKVEQPSVDAQRTYASIRDNDATIVTILGTKKKYKIRWLKNGQIDKLSRLLIRKGDTDDKDGKEDNPLDAVLSDSKLACKAAAIYILDGYWKIKFRYWFLWRWFYYIRQYDNIQLQKLLDEGKKKVPLTPFLMTTMSLTGARATLMNMRTEEAEHILQELATAQQEATEKQDNT